MKTNITKQELNEGLINVRSAYRLIFEHQKRVLNTIDYIKDKFGMKADGGNKFFSDPISIKRADYPEVWTSSGMWAWDFLYSYCFEFYFGNQEIKIDDLSFRFDLSVVQVSDTGFWDSENEHKTELDTQTFNAVKSSESYFVFVFESKIDGAESYWNDKDKLGKELYPFLESKENFKVFDTTNGKCQNSKFLMIKYNMSDFIDQQATDIVINQYKSFVFNHTKLEL
ncbi:hypothetical protein [Myroides profundi]|uniref:Uncharacterized protein n=1 Tax=Myroides profundi TaxID=480520 RepID=A0AAJ4W4G1_MYRPR|nr:hypothetical protein [Myroides profundi]AJH14536.1 hypothetical protein MPR_1354 [Myroides profundi]SEQ93404.1 hypothetical protein SAMN04488089_107154 [Myroides profundi]